MSVYPQVADASFNSLWTSTTASGDLDSGPWNGSALTVVVSLPEGLLHCWCASPGVHAWCGFVAGTTGRGGGDGAGSRAGRGAEAPAPY